MSSPEQAPDRVGQVLLGKLRVVRHLGGGGMGDVYEVEHMLTHHRRALKIVRAELARQPRYVERLLREASVAGRLQTPFVAETLDAGRLEDGSAYVLMELLSGRSLFEVLEVEPRLPQRRVANILCQVAEGMSVAHAAGIVHRDLKPENVYLVGDDHEDRVKILDFGISKIDDPLAEKATRLTREGAVVGTPFYMAPEQAAGREVDARADVWAMGVIMYEALTGKLPFNGSTVGEVMMLIGSGMYPPVSTRRPDVDAGLCAVIDRALRVDPRDRYESAEAMRRELVKFAANEPAARAKTISDGEGSGPPERPLPRHAPLAHAAPTKTPTPTPAPDAEPARATSISSETQRARRNSAILLSVVVAVTIAVTIFVSTSQRLPEETTPPETTVASAMPREAIVPTTSVPPPSVAVAEIDAGSVAVIAPPATTTADAPPRPPPHTRTRAEIVGLESNPY